MIIVLIPSFSNILSFKQIVFYTTMINYGKNPESWWKRLVQIMKSSKPKEITVKQLEQTIQMMKQNPEKELHITTTQIRFWMTVTEK